MNLIAVAVIEPHETDYPFTGFVQTCESRSSDTCVENEINSTDGFGPLQHSWQKDA
jgi:hypothetical protein